MFIRGDRRFSSGNSRNYWPDPVCKFRERPACLFGLQMYRAIPQSRCPVPREVRKPVIFVLSVYLCAKLGSTGEI